MKNKGFTLIELIAVIVVIVILAAIALPRIGDMRSAANDSAVKANVATVQTAIERALTEGTITKGEAASDVQATLLSGVSKDGFTQSLGKTPYLSTDVFDTTKPNSVTVNLGTNDFWTVTQN